MRNTFTLGLALALTASVWAFACGGGALPFEDEDNPNDAADVGNDVSTDSPNERGDSRPEDLDGVGGPGDLADFDVETVDLIDEFDIDATAPDGVAETVDTLELPENAIVPRFDFTENSFFATPWPSDTRTTDGHPELSSFPLAGGPVLDAYIDEIEDHLTGFSVAPVFYLGLENRLPSPESLPSAAETVSETSPVQLLALGERCGERVPIEVRFVAEGAEFRDDNVLMAAGVPGVALDAARPYAFLVLTSFGQADGFVTFAPPAFAQALAGQSEDVRLSESLAPLADCLEAAGLEADDIAVATVFTTQDPTAELRAMREVALDPERSAIPVVTDLVVVADRSVEGAYTSFAGHYETPIFQRGQTPYAASGGGLELDDDGLPMIQRWEEVPFTLTVPLGVDEPIPVLVWEDGTGAQRWHHLDSNVVQESLAEGLAVASFSPQFHVPRTVEDSQVVLYTYNYLNAEAGRTNFRQQAVDTSYFVWLLNTDDLEGVPDLDCSRLLYGGHSQGGLVGALLAGVETEIVAYVLNGTGAYVSPTIVERTDPIDIEATLSQVLGITEPLDRFHPVVQIAQLASDVVDPLGYVRSWQGFSGHPEGAHVLVINGAVDTTTPVMGVNAMTLSANLDAVNEPGWDADPFDVFSPQVLTLPASGNRTSTGGDPLTMGTYLSLGSGHFTIFDVPDARAIALGFWQTALLGTPVFSLE